jgi:hypothetical protein
MRQKVLDVLGLVIVLVLIMGGFALCSEEVVGGSDLEQRCNQAAVDSLNAGRSPEAAVAEHARCLGSR